MQNDNKIMSSNTGKEDLNSYDLVMHEHIIEFFASIVEKVHKIDSELLKPYKRDIIDLFNSETFFQMNMVTLKQW